MYIVYRDIFGIDHTENDNEVIAVIPIDSDEYLIAEGFTFSDFFSTYRGLLTEEEIHLGLNNKYPKAIISMFCCEIQPIGLMQCIKLEFPTAESCCQVEFSSHECCTDLNDIVRQKFSGKKKYIATHDEQSLLIGLGIIKTKHAKNIGEAGLEHLLAHDLGL